MYYGICASRVLKNELNVAEFNCLKVKLFSGKLLDEGRQGKSSHRLSQV